MILDKIQLKRVAEGEEIRDFDGTYRKPTAWEATFARTILTMQATAPQPERAEGRINRKYLDAAGQEIRDLFARYGSGDYIPTEDEKEIIELTLDNILIALVEKGQTVLPQPPREAKEKG